MVTLGYPLGYAHALNDPLAETLAEVEAVTLGESLGDSHSLNDALAHTLEEVEAVTFRETLGIRRHWSTRGLTR